MSLMEMVTVWCGGCKTDKLPADFHRCSARPNGLQTQCKDCQAVRQKTRYDANPEHYRAMGKAHAARPTSKIRRFEHSLRAHGLTRERFDEFLVEQVGRCANEWCLVPLIGDRTPHIDHNHTCCPGRFGCVNCVCGLLCKTCNLAAGMLGDCPVRARGIAEYLERTRG